MKKSHLLYVVFGILILTLYIFNFYSNSVMEKNIHQNNNNLHKTKSEIPDSYKDDTESFYLVKENNNEIFLHDKNMNIIRKLDIDFSGLRDYDKKIFVSGIRFENISDVYNLIEDFSN